MHNIIDTHAANIVANKLEFAGLSASHANLKVSSAAWLRGPFFNLAENRDSRRYSYIYLMQVAMTGSWLMAHGKPQNYRSWKLPVSEIPPNNNVTSALDCPI
ncbi:hypothetical protein MN608_07775 [Microdochium nivale]|nr:hypothetical protein MN608_07775 [Microdochium nivale]